MKKKIIFIGILIIGIVLVSFYSLRKIETDEDKTGVGTADPSAVYCNQLGYKFKIVDEGARGQYGVCVFPDGSECRGWKFYSGKCGEKWSYCIQQGYDLLVKTDGKDPYSPTYVVCIDKITGEEIGSVYELYLSHIEKPY